MHTRRLSLAFVSVFVSVFLVFSGFAFSNSRFTFAPPVAHADAVFNAISDIIEAIAPIIVMVAIAYIAIEFGPMLFAEAGTAAIGAEVVVTPVIDYSVGIVTGEIVGGEFVVTGTLTGLSAASAGVITDASAAAAQVGANAAVETAQMNLYYADVAVGDAMGTVDTLATQLAAAQAQEAALQLTLQEATTAYQTAQAEMTAALQSGSNAAIDAASTNLVQAKAVYDGALADAALTRSLDTTIAGLTNSLETAQSALTAAQSAFTAAATDLTAAQTIAASAGQVVTGQTVGQVAYNAAGEVVAQSYDVIGRALTNYLGFDPTITFETAKNLSSISNTFSSYIVRNAAGEVLYSGFGVLSETAQATFILNGGSVSYYANTLGMLMNGQTALSLVGIGATNPVTSNNSPTNSPTPPAGTTDNNNTSSTPAVGDVCYGPTNGCNQAYTGILGDTGGGALGCYQSNNPTVLVPTTAPPDSSCTQEQLLPRAMLTVAPETVDEGQATFIAWTTTTNATSCTGIGFSTGGAKVGNMTSGPLTTTSSYQLYCSNTYGNSPTVSATVNVLNPEITAFSANPTRVRAGTSSTISWNASGIKSCIVEDSFGGRVGSSTPADAVSHSFVSSVSPSITTQTTFTITCQTNRAPMTRSVIVNVVPSFQEF